MRLLLAVGLLLLSAPCLAQLTCWGGTTFTSTPPSTIAIPRDASNGTVLWIGPNQNAANIYGCNIGGSVSQSFGAYSSLYNRGTDTGISVAGMVGGTRKALTSGVAGIGIAVGGTMYLYDSVGGGCNLGWLAWGDMYPNGTGTHCWHSGAVAGHSINAGFAFQLALVKTGTVTGGTLGARTIARGALYCDPDRGQNCAGMYTYFNISQVTFVSLACVTPDVTVNLGEHGPTAFTGVGSATAPVNFTIHINSCPAGISGVWYGFNYPSEAFRGDTANGIINLDAASSARGVAIQMLDANGSPVRFDQWFGLPGYNTAGGNYQLQMKARYLQRAATVTPGTANSYILLTMHYH